MSACLMGSGTLFREQAMVRAMAECRESLWPTDTYTGLAAPSDVRTAWGRGDGGSIELHTVDSLSNLGHQQGPIIVH